MDLPLEKVSKITSVSLTIKANDWTCIKPTIIFKTIGTRSPEAFNLRKIESPTPPFQCCVPIFILFQAPTVCAYNTTTLIGERGGEGRGEM